MKLKILMAGPYNGTDGRAVECHAGDELITTPAYGQSLIDSGYAALLEVDEFVDDTPKKRSKKSAKGAAPSRPGNPFVGG
jgi:hypothetical protein